MAKLSKAQFKAHNEAEELLKNDALSWDDRELVLANWDPSARHVNSAAGAFFTPSGLAFDFALMLGNPPRILDLCAGIGALSFAIAYPNHHDRPEIVCVEKNPDYVRVGRKVLPEAEWIEADVLDVPGMNLGRFDAVISNPPFGKIKRDGNKTSPNYKGADFEFHVIDIAMSMSDFGMFILPQMSAGFKYSGRPFYERDKDGKAFEYQRQRGLHFDACSIDANVYRDQWKGTGPTVEVVSVEPQEAEAAASDLPLFEVAA